MNKLINFLRINPGDTHSQVREKIEKLFERVEELEKEVKVLKIHSNIKKAFEDGKEGYNNPKFVYNPKSYDGPMATNYLDENGKLVGEQIEPKKETDGKD